MTTKHEKLISNKEVKSSAFTAYFSTPENAAKLYEALVPGDSILPGDINYTTLEDVLFMTRKNDLAFTIRNKVLVISEHQSTINLNMPLRDSIYYGRTMEKLIEPRSLYRTRRIPIPTPEFYVFYNGIAPCPAEKILLLSDSYLEKTPDPMLELKVKVMNINLPENHPILAKCRPLYEYSWFIEQIKRYLRTGSNRDKAIIQAVKDCLKENIMKDFLATHGTEAINMLYTEFNMEDALEVRYEEGVEEGVERGLERGREEGQAELLRKLAVTKHAQGKSPEIIAAELETTTEFVLRLLK